MLRLVLSIFILALTLNSIAQPETVKTKSGKTVILNPDGTWKYVEEVATAELPKKGSDCANYIQTKEDRVTGKKTTSAKETIIVSDDGGKTGLSFLMLQGTSSIIVAIRAVGAGNCIDEKTKINILFQDGSRLELLSDADFNCKGEATLYFGGIFGKKRQLEELTTKKIQTMRVWTRDGYVENDFSDTHATEFLQTLSCLSKM